MSLFDNIKYPISELVTENELAAIPNELFVKWVSDPRFGWEDNDIRLHIQIDPLTPYIVSWWVRLYPDSGKLNSQLLRKLIQEHESV